MDVQDEVLVPCFEAPVAQARELERRLVAADIPATLGGAPKQACCSAGGCGCGAKVLVLVREADVARVAELFRSDWLEAVKKEGTLDGMTLVPAAAAPHGDGEPPCPGCGCTQPLVAGACADCGLQLE